MVVKVNGEVAANRPEPGWRIWMGPVVLAGLFVGFNLQLLAAGGWGMSSWQVAAVQTILLVAVAVPFLRLVREVNVEEYGVEIHLYRGARRYFRWDEIDSITVHRHVLVPSRMRMEDVYGRRVYLKGDVCTLEPLIQEVGVHSGRE